MATIASFAAAALLGALLGLLVGLSGTPVVAGVVSAVTALFAGFFVFNAALPAAAVARVAGLGLGMAPALVLGVALRAHEALSPAPLAAVQALTGAGFPAEEARALVALHRYGATLRPGQAPAVAIQAPRGQSALWNQDEAALCARLALVGAAEETAAILDGTGPSGAPLARLLRAGAVPPGPVREALCGA